MTQLKMKFLLSYNLKTVIYILYEGIWYSGYEANLMFCLITLLKSLISWLLLDMENSPTELISMEIASTLVRFPTFM